MTLSANLLLVVVIIAASFQCNAVASLTADEYVDNNTPSWAKAFQCTITTDGGKPTLMNKSTCTTTAKDASDKPCIWCDATATIGTGICVSSNVKGMTGQYWDQFCKSSSNTDPNPPVGPVPTTPPPTPSPTPPPVPNDIPDSLRCSMDASHNVITDKTKCTTEQKDASNKPCYWCNIPLLGGTCVTDSMKSTLGFMCQDQQEQPNMATLFVQLVEKIGTAWKQFDPSCFGDWSIGLVTNKDVCTARTDKIGRACVWWDAPSGDDDDKDDKFGICATSDQKEYVCSHMDCDDKTHQMEDNLDTTVVDNVVNVE
jgi:hypothetical protein